MAKKEEHQDFTLSPRTGYDPIAAQMLRVSGAEVKVLANGDMRVTNASADATDNASMYGNIQHSEEPFIKLG